MRHPNRRIDIATSQESPTPWQLGLFARVLIALALIAGGTMAGIEIAQQAVGVGKPTPVDPLQCTSATNDVSDCVRG